MHAPPLSPPPALTLPPLAQRFDPNMKTFGKIEDEVVTFFKRLNYPFQVRGGGGGDTTAGLQARGARRNGGHTP